MAKQDTIKFINEKVRNNGDASDYESIPFGADSDNVDRPDGSTAEENFVNIDNGVDIGRTLKYEDPYLYLLDGEGKELSRVLLVLPLHVHNYTIEEITKEATYTEAGLKKCTCACGDYHTEEIPMLVDSTNPTGTITVGENTYTSLVENPSFDTYFKTAQNVTITGVDNESGVKNISYYVSDTKVDETGLADVAWVPYDSGFTIEPNRNAIVYAKITDNQDNVTYICSNGIVLDNIAPVFNGMEDGGTYGVGTTLTLQDGETLFVNGEEVELIDNAYTFNVEDNYLLSIKDRAGNESSINVTIEHVHEYTAEIIKEATCTENGEKRFTCNSCGHSYTEIIPVQHNVTDGVCTVCGETIAPLDEYKKWSYTLNNTNNSITLNKYIGTDENVTVYANYLVDGKYYKTKIGNYKT